MLDRLDHLVLTVADVEATCAWYARALAMTPVTFGEGRRALAFGKQKINLHQVDRTVEPKARAPTAGSGDLCFVAAVALDEVIAHLERVGIPIAEGPVPRTGALGPIRSIYLRDPDGNLVEVASYGD
jgi:catechol 2,3-dioxygenase-like lactoylglutathione lyase family enzyme